MPPLPMLRRIRQIGDQLLERAGFRLEIRRSGESSLGLWRKKNQKGHPFRISSRERRLVIVPGFGDTPLSWYPSLMLLMPTLRRLFDEVIIFDFPGFNGSLMDLPCFPSTAGLGRCALEALASLRPHTLIGHSLGGWVSAWYASIHAPQHTPASSSKPRHLILMAPAAHEPTSNGEERLDTIFRRTLYEGIEVLRPRLFAKEPIWFNLVADYYKAFLGRRDVQDFIQESINSTSESQGSHVWNIHQLAEIPQSTRVSLIWGEKDRLVHTNFLPVWMRDLRASGVRSLQAYEILGVGHTPQIESPAVLAFLIHQSLIKPTGLNQKTRWFRSVS